ncbi:serine/threonine-protein kinase Nek11 [Aplochiton taeniatus]
MLRFQETDGPSPYNQNLTYEPSSLVARRYRVIQTLGRGSFGSVYLVQDTKSRDGEEELKVLKQIPVGDLRPNETVRASQEALLLSCLQHPAILSFHSSFLERGAFCIITEYCQDKDLDCKLEEQREAGRRLPETQVSDWLIQLLLGLHYMHSRRILHRDLKAKNIFLKRNIVKIGDFGVACLLVGSCDLATTFTGTPYYMSPEVLCHHGYDSKADIWALGCILYQMCCLAQAFQGHNFLSVVKAIVEGETPVLPDSYSKELNSVMERMLEKKPSSRLSAAEALRTPYLERSMRSMKQQFSCLSLRDQPPGAERDATMIAREMQRKGHMDTLQERLALESLSPRERLRLRKLQAGDDQAKRLSNLATLKHQENQQRRQELRRHHFEKVSLDVLNDSDSIIAYQTPPITIQDCQSLGCSQPVAWLQQKTMIISESTGQDIPEDPQTAEDYYNQDGFESCSEEEEEEEEEESLSSLYLADPEEGDLEAMMKHMEKVLEGEMTELDSEGGLIEE